MMGKLAKDSERIAHSLCTHNFVMNISMSLDFFLILNCVVILSAMHGVGMFYYIVQIRNIRFWYIYSIWSVVHAVIVQGSLKTFFTPTYYWCSNSDDMCGLKLL